MAKLQDLAEAFRKLEGDVRIEEHNTYRAGFEPLKIITVKRGDQTLGGLTQAANGRWSFTAPENALFNDVAPLVGILDGENIKLGLSEPATE